jgi:hypothetical protein
VFRQIDLLQGTRLDLIHRFYAHDGDAEGTKDQDFFRRRGSPPSARHQRFSLTKNITFANAARVDSISMSGETVASDKQRIHQPASSGAQKKY